MRFDQLWTGDRFIAYESLWTKIGPNVPVVNGKVNSMNCMNLRTQNIAFQMGIQKAKLVEDPIKWLNQWSNAPLVDLAILYRIIARNYNEPEKIGQEVNRIFTDKLQTIATQIVESQMEKF